MYCVKCGVELADSQRSCPLCKTPVYYPGIETKEEKNYPEFVSYNEKISPRGIYFVTSFLFSIAIIITALCDYRLNAALTFGGYAVGGLAFFYIAVFLPLWFRRKSPAVFLPIDTLALLIYLFYINYATGGSWFLNFAMPVTLFGSVIILSSVIVRYYVRRGILYIAGGALILSGVYALFIEWLINLNFGVSDKILWAYYPMVALVLFGIMLIIIAIVKPFRESLRKIFAL